MLAVVTLVGIVALIAVPQAAALAENGRAAAAARQIATTMQALRWQAVAMNRHHGLLFDRDARGWYWLVVRDGNGNGLRTAEVRGGVDPVLSGPHRPEDQVSGTALGYPGAGSFPDIPPRSGTVGGADPVRFGRSDLVSFSPEGSASSGTVFVTDRRNALYGVVLFGPSCRARVWRYDRRVGRWNL
jgi:hypothetical protein